MKNEYLSLEKIAKKYDLHKDTIRKKIPTMKEGIHFVRINNRYRFHIDNIHSFLTGINPHEDIEIEKYFL